MITATTQAPPAILEVMEELGFRVFRGVESINLIGFRSLSRVAGAFDDWICTVMLSTEGQWVTKWYPATTDPGVPWLRSPMNHAGAAVVAHGQILGAFTMGLHLGVYRCLVQAKPIGVLRDDNRNDLIDPPAGSDVGWHGIQLHRASAVRLVDEVGKFSAGCQVVQDPDDYDDLISDVDLSMLRHGPTVSYSLVDVARLTSQQAQQISGVPFI